GDYACFVTSSPRPPPSPPHPSQTLLFQFRARDPPPLPLLSPAGRFSTRALQAAQLALQLPTRLSAPLRALGWSGGAAAGARAVGCSGGAGAAAAALARARVHPRAAAARAANGVRGRAARPFSCLRMRRPHGLLHLARLGGLHRAV